MQVIIKFEKLYYNNYIQNYYLRGLDGRGHFKTILISFKRRALYKYIGNIQILELKYEDIFNTK